MRLFLLISALFFMLNTNAQTKVLFLGNSFTYTYDIPTLFNGFATAAGIPVTIDQNTQAGMAVADEQITGHVHDATSQAKISSQQWDFIVIQDNMGDYVNAAGIPSSCGNANVALYNQIKANNPCTRIIYFAGWGPFAGAFSGDDAQSCIDRIYANMLYLNNGIGAEIVTPIGKAWKSSLTQLPSVNLYYSDNVHPSLEGSYLAAATIFTSIFKIDPTNLSYTGAVNSSTAQTMRIIAFNTVTDPTFFTATHLSSYTPTLTQTGSLLSVPTGFSAYQWYKNGSPIGTNSHTYTVTSNGHYQVKATNSAGCSVTSFDVNFTTTAIENADVAPDNFDMLSTGTNLFELRSISMGIIAIYDMQGKLVNTFEKKNEEAVIDLSNSTAGVYLIILSNGKSKFSKKISIN